MLVSQTDRNPGVLTIGLVASDDALRSSVRLLLTVSGMVVHEYRTGQDLLAAGPGSYSCLVVDCQPAGRSGCELCMETIRQNEQVPVVVLAASPEALKLTDAARMDIRVVSKPFEGDVLIHAIEESAGGGPDDKGEASTLPDAYPAVS